MQITTGKIEKAQKVVLYGVEGIGKSTFASEFPDPLFIDTEGSTAHMDVKRFDRPKDWNHLLDQIRHVIQNPSICRTLVIDTVDWAEAMCKEHLLSKNNWASIESPGYGKGYVALQEEFSRILQGLELVIQAGVHVVLTAHAKITKFEQPDELGAYDRWELKLEKKVAPLVKEWADMVLFANYKTIVVNVDDKGATKGKNKARGGTRVMYTTHHPAWDAKNRHNLEMELPFLYASISDVLPKLGNQTPPAPDIQKSEVKSDPPVDTSWTKGFEEETPNTSTRANEIKKENPKTKWADAFEQAENEQPQTIQEAMKEDKPEDEVPEKLKELLLKHTVTVEEVKKAVASRGYYPEDAPIKSYAPEFVQGVLIEAWDQVHELIKQGRNNK